MAIVATVDTFVNSSTTTVGSDWHAVMEAHYDAFIAVVNAHASNANKQLSRPKGYVDASGTNNYGQLVLCTRTGYSNYGMITRQSASATTYSNSVISDWTDSTSNNNYGTYTSLAGAATSSAFTGGAGAADILCMYDDTEGQEFLAITQRTYSNTYMNTSMVAKDTQGEWMFYCGVDAIAATSQYCVGMCDNGAADITPTRLALCPTATLQAQFALQRNIVFDSAISSSTTNRITARVQCKVANPKAAMSSNGVPLTPVATDPSYNQDFVTLGGGLVFDFYGV